MTSICVIHKSRESNTLSINQLQSIGLDKYPKLELKTESTNQTKEECTQPYSKSSYLNLTVSLNQNEKTFAGKKVF